MSTYNISVTRAHYSLEKKSYSTVGLGSNIHPIQIPINRISICHPDLKDNSPPHTPPKKKTAREVKKTALEVKKTALDVKKQPLDVRKNSHWMFKNSDWILQALRTTGWVVTATQFADGICSMPRLRAHTASDEPVFFYSFFSGGEVSKKSPDELGHRAMPHCCTHRAVIPWAKAPIKVIPGPRP